ncbi:hypothetical protein [Hufsiella ginkgonis]|uniref:hypothetical protein n=1 Tax=Hufsiella ginkgonis TaxID=2695274 RepID=UPI0019272A49|nr:hypothetical protein [Hufsiella ginkgonis]
MARNPLCTTELLGKIFQPFFTTRPTGQDTGPGLSISYDIIVNGHNGGFSVVAGENNYTGFTLTLPV